MGKLIVFEGACDGIGKSTQVERLCEHLERNNIKVYRHHFPSYDTVRGMPVQEYLNGKYENSDELSPYFINSLFAVDRGITWYKELKRQYDDDRVIVLDRYTTSSLIYQSALIDDFEERKKFIDYVVDFEYNKIGIKMPDKVIFLMAPFELITEMRNIRKNNDGVANDIYETNLEYLKKVYDNALFVAKYLKWDIVKCNNKNKMRSIEDIHNDIYNLISK